MQASSNYSFTWRVLHWLIALLVMILIPVGLWMTSRGEANIWDDLANLLYAWHKAIGFTVLCLMVLRLAIRLRTGHPPYPASMSHLLVLAANTVHRLMYVLLLVVPLLGWAGVTAFPALITLGGYHLPAFPFVAPNETLAKQLFEIHGTLALILAALIIGHIGAAFMHLLIKRDGIFQRMWFGK